uniref:Uncharacterized protein n=1 Tax=Cyprinus carpio TaxID=7962 RepID=A0A8C2E4P0_CYPCA
MAVAGFDVVFQNCCIAVFKSEGIETVSNEFTDRFFHFKKLHGRLFQDHSVQAEEASLTYHLVPLNDRKVGIQENTVPLSIIMLSPGKC